MISDQQRITRCKRLRYALSKFCLRRTSFTPEPLYEMLTSGQKNKNKGEIMVIKMKNETGDYGNWVPKKMLIAFFVLTLLFSVVLFLPVHIIVRFIFGSLAVASLLFFLYFYYSYHVFGANGGAFQKKIINLVVNKLAWDGRGKALDIGTGAGALAISVAKTYPNAKVTGIDYWGKGWSYSKEMPELRGLAIELPSKKQVPPVCRSMMGNSTPQ